MKKTNYEEEVLKIVCEILAFYKYTDDEIQAETTEEIARKIINIIDKKAKSDFLKMIDERLGKLKKRLERAKENYEERTREGQKGFTFAKCYVVIDEKMVEEFEELKSKLGVEK